MSVNRKDIEIISKVFNDLSKVNIYNLKCQLDELQEREKTLFEFAKFKVGDVVQLSETPVINENQAHGWIGYKDILTKGAIAEIKKVDCYKGAFKYDLHFIVSNKGTFRFNENDIEFNNKVHICPQCKHIVKEN